MKTKQHKNFRIKTIMTFVLSLVFLLNVTQAFADNDVQNIEGTKGVIEQVAPRMVKYKVRFVDEKNDNIYYIITKIAFTGEVVKEKAYDIKGYELISEKVQKKSIRN